MSNTVQVLKGQHILLSAEYLHFGGTRTYLLRLLNLYKRAGAHVTLVTTLLDDDPDMHGFLARRGFDFFTFSEVMAGAGFKDATGHPTVWSFQGWRDEKVAFSVLARRIGATRSVVSVGTPGLLLSAAAALPNPVVLAHGYPHGRRQRLLGRPYLSRIIPRNTKFVSMSEYESQVIRSVWNLERSNSHVVTVLSTDGQLVDNISSSKPPWTVLTASLVEPYKRPLDWIRVADQVIRHLPGNTVEFVWLGEGSLLDDARSAAAQTDSASHIHFPGLSLDTAPAYARARVYLQLSSTENMSLSTLDAQRHGIPCVVTNTGGLPEIVQDGVNGAVVSCGDTNKAANAIINLLTDPELWRRSSEASINRYVNRHSPEVWETQMLSVHEERS